MYVWNITLDVAENGDLPISNSIIDCDSFPLPRCSKAHAGGERQFAGTNQTGFERFP